MDINGTTIGIIVHGMPITTLVTTTTIRTVCVQQPISAIAKMVFTEIRMLQPAEVNAQVMAVL